MLCLCRWGADLVGEGKACADWNACLLRDPVSDSYTLALDLARTALGPTPMYYNLFPLDAAPEPYSIARSSILASLVKSDCVFATAPYPQWVAPASSTTIFVPDNALLPPGVAALVSGPTLCASRDQDNPAITALAGAASVATILEAAAAALSTAGLNIVDCPTVVACIMSEGLDQPLQCCTPSLVRKCLREGTLGPVSAGRPQLLAERLLDFCLLDCVDGAGVVQETPFKDLLQVPLLLTAAESSEKFAAADDVRLLVSPEEYLLLSPLCPHLLLASTLSQFARHVLASGIAAACTQVRVPEPTRLCHLIHDYPPESPSTQWVSALWHHLASMALDWKPLQPLQLLPCGGGTDCRTPCLHPLSTDKSQVLVPTSASLVCVPACPSANFISSAHSPCGSSGPVAWHPS